MTGKKIGNDIQTSAKSYLSTYFGGWPKSEIILNLAGI